MAFAFKKTPRAGLPRFCTPYHRFPQNAIIANLSMFVRSTIVYVIDKMGSMQHEFWMNPESLYAEIGERIRTLRKANRLRQHELADRAGMSRASLANMELGRQKVLVHQLFAIANALGRAPVELLPVPASPLRMEDLPLPDDLKPAQRDQIARMLLDLPAADKEPNDAAKKKR